MTNENLRQVSWEMYGYPDEESVIRNTFPTLHIGYFHKWILLNQEVKAIIEENNKITVIPASILTFLT